MTAIECWPRRSPVLWTDYEDEPWRFQLWFALDWCFRWSIDSIKKILSTRLNPTFTIAPFTLYYQDWVNFWYSTSARLVDTSHNKNGPLGDPTMQPTTADNTTGNSQSEIPSSLPHMSSNNFLKWPFLHFQIAILLTRPMLCIPQGPDLIYICHLASI